MLFITKFKNLLTNFRKEFGWNIKRDQIKVWEFICLALGIFSKEIIELLLSTFSSKTTLSSLNNSSDLLKNDLFWIVLFKVVFGLPIVGYLICKYKKSNNIKTIIAFSFLLILIFTKWKNQDTNTGASTNIEPIHQITTSIFLLILIMFLFFVLDTSDIDALKLIFYSESYYDQTNQKLWKRGGISWNRFFRFLAISISITFISMFTLKIFLLTGLFGENESQNQKTVEDALKKTPILSIIQAIIVAPIIEEYIFRNMVMKLNKSNWTIIIGSFLFSLIHINHGEGLIYIVKYIIPSLIFGFSFKLINNIWATIFAHSFYNTILVFIFFLGQSS